MSENDSVATPVASSAMSSVASTQKRPAPPTSLFPRGMMSELVSRISKPSAGKKSGADEEDDGSLMYDTGMHSRAPEDETDQHTASDAQSYGQLTAGDESLYVEETIDGDYEEYTVKTMSDVPEEEEFFDNESAYSYVRDGGRMT